MRCYVCGAETRASGSWTKYHDETLCRSCASRNAPYEIDFDSGEEIHAPKGIEGFNPEHLLSEIAGRETIAREQRAIARTAIVPFERDRALVNSVENSARADYRSLEFSVLRHADMLRHVETPPSSFPRRRRS